MLISLMMNLHFLTRYAIFTSMGRGAADQTVGLTVSNRTAWLVAEQLEDSIAGQAEFLAESLQKGFPLDKEGIQSAYQRLLEKEQSLGEVLADLPERPSPSNPAFDKRWKMVSSYDRLALALYADGQEEKAQETHLKARAARAQAAPLELINEDTETLKKDSRNDPELEKALRWAISEKRRENKNAPDFVIANAVSDWAFEHFYDNLPGQPESHYSYVDWFEVVKELDTQESNSV